MTLLIHRSAHWKGKRAIHSDRNGSFSQEIKTESQRLPSRSSTRGSIAFGDDSDDDQPPRLGKHKVAPPPTMQHKPPSRASSRVPSTRATSKPNSRAGSTVPVKRTVTSRPNKQALFLDSDDDIEEAVDDHRSQNTELSKTGFGDDSDDDEQTLRSSAAARRSTNTMEKPRAVAIRGRGRKAPTADDDSDDGAVFKGFGKRKR